MGNILIENGKAVGALGGSIGEYVEVIPGANDTWATILRNLNTALSGHTVSTNARFVFTYSGVDSVFNLSNITSNGCAFEHTQQSAAGIYVQMISVSASPSNTTASVSSSGTFSRSDYTSSVATNVTSVRIYL